MSTRPTEVNAPHKSQRVSLRTHFDTPTPNADTDTRMRTVTTTGSSSIAHLFMGDRRLKRVALKITSKLNPNRLIHGYALVNELAGKMFTFFCTEKFALDEELQVQLHFGGHDLTYRILMSHLHEQISSGRIMNSLPTEENPFPARKFYRCFAKVLELQGMDGETPVTTADDSPTTQAA